MSFATSWVNLRGITLSKINQTDEDGIAWFHLYMEYKKQKVKREVKMAE